MRLTVSSTYSKQAQHLDALARNSQAAATDALKRTLAKSRTAMSRQIRQEFSIKAATVADYLRVRKPTQSGQGLEGELYARDPRRRSFNLIRFAARQTRVGVSFRVRRAGGRPTLSSAFIANDGRTVFMRVPGTRMDSRRPRRSRGGTQHGQKIKAVSTIAVQQMFNADRVRSQVQAFALDELRTQLLRALAKQTSP